MEVEVTEEVNDERVGVGAGEMGSVFQSQRGAPPPHPHTTRPTRPAPPSHPPQDPEYIFSFPEPEGSAAPPIIAFNDVDFGYPGGPTLFK